MYSEDLIIGDTSQLSYYFPEEIIRISSRNIDFTNLKKRNYRRIYILFAEQRTYLSESEEFFNKINFDLTIKVIDELLGFCENIIIYSTSELFNGYKGAVSLDMKYKYFKTPYIQSKELVCNYINLNRKKYNNVLIIYPFNFNSIYRNENFLFGKVFNSLRSDKKISIGDVDFERDLVHPKIVVNHSLTTNEDLLIGSGETFNVKKFIHDLFTLHNKNVNEYIEINNKNSLPNKRNEYFSEKKYSTYEELIKLTMIDLNGHKIS